MSAPASTHGLSWPSGATRFIAMRLRPGEDLRPALQARFEAEPEQAGFVTTAVGSLTWAHLRLAGRDEPTRFMGPLEIVSLVGTFSVDGPHLHLCAAPAEGHAIGGHLLEDSPIYTTGEIILGLVDGVLFERAVDPETGYAELSMRPL